MSVVKRWGWMEVWVDDVWWEDGTLTPTYALTSTYWTFITQLKLTSVYKIIWFRVLLTTLYYLIVIYYNSITSLSVTCRDPSWRHHAPAVTGQCNAINFVAFFVELFNKSRSELHNRVRQSHAEFYQRNSHLLNELYADLRSSYKVKFWTVLSIRRKKWLLCLRFLSVPKESYVSKIFMNIPKSVAISSTWWRSSWTYCSILC
jgi:hypothetical protein